MRTLPKHFTAFQKTYPKVASAYEQFGAAVHAAGPLDARTRTLVKCAIAIAAGLEGGTHAQVRKALDAGHAAATILPSNVGQNVEATEGLRIAFDGDAVLFSDEAERVYKREGLEAFTASEVSAAKEPLSGGPFKSFLAALHRIQSEYPADRAPIRTALVTARSAPAHERVVRTLRAWNIRIDEALFLGGLDKGPFLKAFGADIFFDDQRGHCESASRHVATGHVPFGVANE